MKIKRVVNGQEIEFELTGAELTQAAKEESKYNDREDLETVIDEDFDEEVKLTEKEMTAAIELYKKYRSNDDQWRYDAENAINEIIKERGVK